MELKDAIGVVTEQSKAFGEVVRYLVEAFTDGRRRRAITEVLDDDEHRYFNSLIKVIEVDYKEKIRGNKKFTINDLLSNLDHMFYVRHSIVLCLDEVLQVNDLERDRAELHAVLVEESARSGPIIEPLIDFGFRWALQNAIFLPSRKIMERSVRSALHAFQEHFLAKVSGKVSKKTSAALEECLAHAHDAIGAGGTDMGNAIDRSGLSRTFPADLFPHQSLWPLRCRFGKADRLRSNGRLICASQKGAHKDDGLM